MAKGDYGFNGTISSPGIGKKRIRVTKLAQKISVIAEDDEARSRRAFYPRVVTSSGFTMEIAFISYGERSQFNFWLSTYLKTVVDGTARSGTMEVLIPAYDFQRTCVPRAVLEYGEGYDDYGYTLPIEFIGASDPLDLSLGAKSAGASFFKMPENREITKYFYPAGRQVKGAESLDGTTFDVPTATPGEPRRPWGGGAF